VGAEQSPLRESRKWAHEDNLSFDDGFLHGRRQSISLPAICYAAMGLVVALASEPPTPAE
jgi:hypothetical protein